MNPFRYSLDRNRFTSLDLSFSVNSTILENSRHFRGCVVVRSLLNEFNIERVIGQTVYRLYGTRPTMARTGRTVRKTCMVLVFGSSSSIQQYAKSDLGHNSSGSTAF